jgi:hypothetical protein
MQSSETEFESPAAEADRKGTNRVLLVVIILGVLLVCCLVVCIAVFLLLAPTTGSVFSNIIEGIQTPIP